MGGENWKFKSEVFGGFNRRDVINYIEKLASERNELQKENERLSERISEMEKELLDKSSADSATIAQLETELEMERTSAREAREIAAEGAEKIMGEFRSKYDEFREEMKTGLTNAHSELAKSSKYINRFWGMFETAGKRLSEMEQTVSSIRNHADED